MRRPAFYSRIVNSFDPRCSSCAEFFLCEVDNRDPSFNQTGERIGAPYTNAPFAVLKLAESLPQDVAESDSFGLCHLTSTPEARGRYGYASGSCDAGFGQHLTLRDCMTHGKEGSRAYLVCKDYFRLAIRTDLDSAEDSVKWSPTVREFMEESGLFWQVSNCKKYLESIIPKKMFPNGIQEFCRHTKHCSHPAIKVFTTDNVPLIFSGDVVFRHSTYRNVETALTLLKLKGVLNAV